MQFNPPDSIDEFMQLSWPQIEPFYRELAALELSQEKLAAWLAAWSRLYKLVDETRWRLYVATTVDTSDKQAEERYNHYLDEIMPASAAAEKRLQEKLLSSGLQPQEFEVPMRDIRAKVELFREENLLLLSEELKLASEYDRIFGAQTVVWEGQEVTLPQLAPVYQQLERDRREKAWRLASERQLADRPAVNDLWGRFLEVRLDLASNAGLPDYREYRWKQLLRFDYTPEDCIKFQGAIEQVVVPAATRLYEKRRERLGVESLRPWDLEVDPFGRPPLQPFSNIEELEQKSANIFEKVDPQLGAHFQFMRQAGLLDLENRKGKAPGGYCTGFMYSGVPFIFMNAVSLHDDVQTILHEAGHAFHVFERRRLPYHQQYETPMEFNEVASMSMEFLGAPYLERSLGGFYTSQEAARARIEHLEHSLLFWPYMAVVDAFQHWVYTHPDKAMRPENCDATWEELWDRFMPGVDWGGLEEAKRTGWHRKLHIHQDPFYYVEYGLAQLGAVQVWANALRDPTVAVASYRQALALGNTVTLPELYAAAGVRFAFDALTLRQAVDLMELTIEQLEAL